MFAQLCFVLFLSFLWGSRIKRKREFWFLCLFMSMNSPPSVLLADLLNIRPQLVRRFPTNKAVLWSQNGAPKNVRVNRLWMYHKQRIFCPCFLPVPQADASELKCRDLQLWWSFVQDPEHEGYCHRDEDACCRNSGSHSPRSSNSPSG